jgi:hypothetical protein
MNPRIVIVALIALGIVGGAAVAGFLPGRHDDTVKTTTTTTTTPPPTTTTPPPPPPSSHTGPGPVPPESASDERKLAWLLASCPRAPCTDDAKLFAARSRRTRSNGDKATLHTALESCLRACAGPR